MFDNLGISKCDNKKSPTVQNYEVISIQTQLERIILLPLSSHEARS